MSKVSKTARASAGQQAPKVKKVLTTEEAIREIRNLRAGHLAVLNVEYIDLLLAAYDQAVAQGNACLSLLDVADKLTDTSVTEHVSN